MIVPRKARIQCLEEFSVALPDGDLHAKKGDIVTVDFRVAKILKKAGKCKILSVYQEE